MLNQGRMIQQFPKATSLSASLQTIANLTIIKGSSKTGNRTALVNPCLDAKNRSVHHMEKKVLMFNWPLLY
jgi:hypothetical protein